jgi:hypothetical protein
MFEDHILNKVVAFVDDGVKFSVLQFVSRDFHAFAWNPEFNTELALAKKAKRNMRLIACSPAKAKQLWSRLKRLKFAGPADEQLFTLFLDLNVSSLERIELEKPSSACVKVMMERIPRARNLRALHIAETELQTVEELNVFAENLPKFSELFLSEVFIVRSAGLVSVPASPSVIDKRESSQLDRLDVYILPFGELLEFFKLTLSTVLLPKLSYLRIRCLTSPGHAEELAAVIDAKVPTKGWAALTDIDVGILTESLVDTIENVSGDAIKTAAFTARVEVEIKRLPEVFPQIQSLTMRVKHNQQLCELIEVIQNSGWKSSLRNIRFSWSLVNSISVETFVQLRILLRAFKHFHACARYLTASTCFDKSPEIALPSSAFDVFFTEMCVDRIVCECDNCGGGTGDVDPSHVIETAEEEWESLPLELKTQYLRNIQI